MALPEHRQQPGAQDRHDIADHRRRYHGRDKSALSLSFDGRIAHRKRQNSFAHAATEDGNDDIEESVPHLIAHQHAGGQSGRNGDDGSRDQWHPNAQESHSEHAMVDAEDAADHEAGDIEIKQVIRLERRLDRLQHVSLEQAVANQRRGHEEAEDRRPPDPSQHRNLAAHMIEEKAHQHHDGQTADHIQGQPVEIGGKTNDDRRHDINRHGNRTQFPPHDAS